MLEDGLRVGKRRELMDIQQSSRSRPLNELDEGIFHGFARTHEVQLHPTPIDPRSSSAAFKFRPMIDLDGARPLAYAEHTIKHLTHRLPGHPKSSLYNLTGETPVIHGGQDPERPSVGQGIMHKIHTPPLVRVAWHRSEARSNAMCLRRRTRFRLTGQPSRRSNTQMR